MTLPNGDNAVVVRDLVKVFGRFTAVDRVSFEVAKGEVFGFLGPNGAGKSTTIRMLCGILEPTSGGGTVAGFDILRQPELIKENIGYMSQRFSLYEDLTVEENIDFYSGIYRIARDKRKARKDWVLEMSGLAARRRSPAGTLPTGWRQRLSLGCALLHEPSVLFLDEPTSGVDPITRRRFWDLIYGLSEQGVTVFVTTHYMDEAEYCGRLGLIYRAKLIACSTPEELKRDVMREDIIEVACDRPQDAMLAVEKVAGVKEAALFGNTVHAVVADTAGVVEGLRAALEAQGLRPTRVEKILPSLEDVFVSLIEAHDRERRPEEEVRR